MVGDMAGIWRVETAALRAERWSTAQVRDAADGEGRETHGAAWQASGKTWRPGSTRSEIRWHVTAGLSLKHFPPGHALVPRLTRTMLGQAARRLRSARRLVHRLFLLFGL
jgi:hypothetical protein